MARCASARANGTTSARSIPVLHLPKRSSFRNVRPRIARRPLPERTTVTRSDLDARRTTSSRSIPAALLVLCCLATGFLLPGCTDVPERTGDVTIDLRSSDPQVRGRAAIDAGRARDVTAVPRLIDLLMDDKYSIRLNALFALNLIVGPKEDFGYKALDPASRRAAAADRYREWWATQQP